MNLLKELVAINEETSAKTSIAKPTKTMRQRVYHADYIKTRKKPYRKYDPEKVKSNE